MDEQRWLSCDDPALMLDPHQWVAGPWPNPLTSPRKLSLFVAAVERAWWGRSETAVPANALSLTLMEALAEGEIGPHSPAARRIAFSYDMPLGDPSACALECVRIHNSDGDPARWAALLRDIMGNPFRPVAIAPSWRTSDVLRIAEAIYRDRAWPDCGVLADALEEAGCADAECETCEVAIQGEKGRATLKMAGLTTTLGGASKKSYLPGCLRCGGTGRVPNPLLAHLRSPGPHARGCHVVDALTGRG